LKRKKSKNWLPLLGELRTQYAGEIRDFREIVTTSQVDELILKAA